MSALEQRAMEFINSKLEADKRCRGTRLSKVHKSSYRQSAVLTSYSDGCAFIDLLVLSEILGTQDLSFRGHKKTWQISEVTWDSNYWGEIDVGDVPPSFWSELE